MGIEIEKKFLIDREKLIAYNSEIFNNGIKIQQGYIAQTEEKTVVRVRLADKKGFLTIKGANIGCSRAEFEYEIPYEDAYKMLNTLCSKRIQKTRYLLPISNHTWEIDVFDNNNEGLIVAEIELDSENEIFDIPNWVTKDITNDKRYYNSNLLEGFNFNEKE